MSLRYFGNNPLLVKIKSNVVNQNPAATLEEMSITECTTNT